MFKYDQFPILKLEVYNNEGILHHKTLRQKSHKPYFQSPNYSLCNIIDFDTGEHLTLKTITKSKTLMKDKILAEISNQQRLGCHPNFVQVRQVYEDHCNIYILMQENYRNLQEVLDARAVLFQREVQYIFCQLVTILESLRVRNIFHGGICLRNLYLDRTAMKIKLSGFGHSINMEKVKRGAHINLYSETELTPYTAPELMDNAIENPLMYYGGDVWSVGVVIYTLLVGEEPFTNFDSEKKLRTPSISKLKNFMYEFPTPELTPTQSQPRTPRTSISQSWKQLLKQIFTAKQNRVTLDKLIKHPLNNITESKFTELTCEDRPRLGNHHLSARDQNFSWLGFQGVVEGMFGGRGGREKRGSLQAPPKLSYSLQEQCQKQNTPRELLTGGQLNTSILRISLQQENHPLPLPLLCQPPPCIQKYCYIHLPHCLGYILDNKIGAIYKDGSCIVGQTDSKFVYLANDPAEDVEHAVKVYVAVYEEFCGRAKGGDFGQYCTGSDSDYVNESSSKNLLANPHHNSNNSSGMKQTSRPMNGTPSKIYSCSSSSKLKKSKMFQTPINPNPNPNPNTSSHSKSFINNPSSQLKNSHRPAPQTLHKSISINQADPSPNQLIKFGQSYLCYSYTNYNLNPNEQISKAKLELYRYLVGYFGERVIETGRDDWVIGFWRMPCGIVFLYCTGVWQVNFSMAVGRQGQGRAHGDCAIVIDKYGLAWWLNDDSGCGDGLANRDGMIDAGCRERENNRKVYNRSNGYYCHNDGYNSLCVKLARELVSQIRNRYIREFESIMQPYEYRQ